MRPRVTAESVTEDVVHKIAQLLIRERNAAQSVLDNTPPGQLRTSYALGLRDGLDQAVDDIVQRRWSLPPNSTDTTTNNTKGTDQ